MARILVWNSDQTPFRKAKNITRNLHLHQRWPLQSHFLRIGEEKDGVSFIHSFHSFHFICAEMLCFFDSSWDMKNQNREMKTRIASNSKSCFFATEKKKFPRVWFLGVDQYFTGMRKDQPRDKALVYQHEYIRAKVVVLVEKVVILQYVPITWATVLVNIQQVKITRCLDTTVTTCVNRSPKWMLW